jgi:hypothetical protein
MEPIVRFRLCAAAVMVALLVGAPAAGQEQDQAGRIIDRIVEGEQQFLAKMQSLRPILETYVQEFEEPNSSGSSLLRDHYLLGRLTVSNGVDVDGITMSARFQKPARNKRFVPLRLTLFSKPSGDQPRDYATSPDSRNKDVISLVPAGWAQMVIPDGSRFNRATYNFVYSRREFLGEVRCLVFEVSPLDNKLEGGFLGTIWVDDQDFRIVRFNGVYTGSKPSKMFFHFDSWRFNAAPGLWVPAFVYI